MADPHVLFALRRKYAETLGMAAAGRGEPKALRSDLKHLAAVLRLFRPAEDLTAIKPIRPHANRGSGKGGTWVKAALTILRTANAPMSAREIAERIATARHITEKRAVTSIECSLLATFRRREGELVVAVGVRPRRWGAA